MTACFFPVWRFYKGSAPKIGHCGILQSFSSRCVACAGAKAFEWQQEIGLNQARRSGEVAVLDNLLEFHLEEPSSSSHMLPGTTDAASAAPSQVCNRHFLKAAIVPSDRGCLDSQC